MTLDGYLWIYRSNNLADEGKRDPRFERELNRKKRDEILRCYYRYFGQDAYFEVGEREVLEFTKCVSSNQRNYTEGELKAYDKSYSGGEQGDFDPQGFLSQIGIHGAHSYLRGDQKILPLFDHLYKREPTFASRFVNRNFQKPIIDLFQKYEAVKNFGLRFFKRMSDFVGITEGVASYGDMLGGKKIRRSKKVLKDVDIIHYYGTYSIAIMLGFDNRQVRRIAVADYAIDTNETPYGETAAELFGATSRHFNMSPSPKTEDRRLVWAKKHLENALEAKTSEIAEQELGYGLHSLQDFFMHAQLTQPMHWIVDGAPDDAYYNPLAFWEASRATAAYLQFYQIERSQ